MRGTQGLPEEAVSSTIAHEGERAKYVVDLRRKWGWPACAEASPVDMYSPRRGLFEQIKYDSRGLMTTFVMLTCEQRARGTHG